jgi:hypothetical protein
MKLSEIRIASRFCGPPGAGNGGYVAGLLAGFTADCVSIRLQARSPLEVALAVHAGEDGVVELHDGATVIASARPATAELMVPAPVSIEVAADAAARYRGLRDHPCPGCFVCGTGRVDGLRIRHEAEREWLALLGHGCGEPACGAIPVLAVRNPPFVCGS